MFLIILDSKEQNNLPPWWSMIIHLKLELYQPRIVRNCRKKWQFQVNNQLNMGKLSKFLSILLSENIKIDFWNWKRKQNHWWEASKFLHLTKRLCGRRTWRYRVMCILKKIWILSLSLKINFNEMLMLIIAMEEFITFLWLFNYFTWLSLDYLWKLKI